MRRGFLKNAEKKKAPVKPAMKHTPPVGEAAVDVPTSVASRGNVLGLESLLKSLQDIDVSGPVNIPETRHTMRYGPNIAKFPNLRKGMRLCALPQYTKGQPVVMCLFYDGTKEAILEKPGWPAPAPYTFNPFELPYTNVDVKGMGVTTVAAKNLQAGEVIMCERPLMITPGAFPTGAHGSRPHDELVKTAVANLDPTSKYLFCSLHNCKPLEAPGYAGIIDTNTVNIGLLPGPYRGIHAAVCSAFSRINHSCVPNAMFLWDLESFTYTVRAIRPIAKGQEIFVSYFSDDYKSREERMKELRDSYKFECTCTCCTLPEAESNQSDVRREFLKVSVLGHETLHGDQDKTIKNILKLPELPILVESIVRTLGAMDKEKVYHFNTWMVHATMLSKIYCALGKREEVAELASKASIMAVAWNGNDDDWYKVAKAPEKTIWWDMAKNMEETE